MAIPNTTLNQLERDPVVHFGCTYSEIQRSGVMSFIKGFIPVFIAGCFINVSLSILAGFILWLVLCSVTMKKIARTRADKPLFYDIHLLRKKAGRFIKPNIVYQTERNIE